MFKLAFNSISPPTALTLLGSLGAHGLLALSLPILPIYSKGESGPLEVPIVELSPEEMARIPALQAPPPVAYIPPSATQLLPVPPNFQLPAAAPRVTPATPSAPTTPLVPAIPVKPSVAMAPALPPRPSVGLSPYPYPTLTPPQRVISRGRGGLPLTPSVPVGRGSSMMRGVASSEALRTPRSVESRTNTFTPNLSAKPEETFRNSLGDSLNPKPQQALPVAPERQVSSPINPGQIRPVAPANRTQGTTVATPAIPLPLPASPQGASAPSQPLEGLKVPANVPQEARNGTVPLPVNNGAQQLQPVTPRGNETPVPSENRDRVPQGGGETERREVRNDKPASEENDAQNRPSSRREEETPTPRSREEATQTPRSREEEPKKPRNREEETPTPRSREEETPTPRRQESRAPENPTPQSSESRSFAPSEQPQVTKKKPAPQEENDAAPESP